MSEMKKEEPKGNYLVPTENVDKRTAFSKTYTVGPGKYQAFTSVIPLHRQNEETGKWEELDAAFKPAKEGDQLESVGAQLTVSCGVSGEKPFMVIRDQKDHCLSWGLEDAEPVKPEALKEEIKEEDHVIQAFRQAMANAEGTVRYSEIFPGVDMICRNDSRFKDEFIFSAPESARPVIFKLETEGLKLSWDEESGLVVFDTDSEKIYNIPAPTLMDNEGQEGMVQVSLEEMKSGYRLIYEPDPEFMESAAYPVVLDPAVRTYNQDYAITDMYVCSKYPNTNYSNKDRVYAQKTEYQGVKDIRYGLVKVTSLPPIGSNHFVTNASLYMQTVNVSGTNPHLYLREMMDDWPVATTTWNNLPPYSDIIQDYISLHTGWNSFNITGPVKKWYQDENKNKGVLITTWEGYCIGAFYGSNSGVSGKPYLKVEYASLAGLEDYMTYDTVSAEKAGTGYVSLVNGNLVFTHSDTQMNGARMPVSVTHVYNSCDADKNDYYCGYGWRTNFHQTLHKELLDSVTYYVYTDGDGTEHWFKSAGSGKYKDESGLSMELTVSGNSTIIRDKADNVLTFPLVTGTPTATQPTTKVLVTAITDACGNTIEVTATGMKITKLKDAAGRETNLEYTNNLLTRIKAPYHNPQASDDCISFSYMGGCLTVIEYEDRDADGNRNTSRYGYYATPSQAHHLLFNVLSHDMINVEFDYEHLNVAYGLPHRVKTSKVSGGWGNNRLVASHTEYTYGMQLCLVKDLLTGNTLRYHFNDNGNCTSVDDGLGYAVYTEYNQSAQPETIPINHPTTISRVERAVNNLLTNGLFGNTTDWTKEGIGTITQSARSGGFGVNQKKFTVANEQTLSCYQMVNVTGDKTYTLSGYVQSLGAKAYLEAVVDNTDDGIFRSPSVELTGTETETELTRVHVTFHVPEGINQIKVSLVAKGTLQGTIAWWDSAQLEVGDTANHVNLLENSDVHDMQGTLPTPWQKDNTYSTVIARSEDMPTHVTGNALRITGKCNATRRVWQSVNVSGSTGDRFTVGGWCSAYAKKKSTDIACQLLVYFATSNASSWSSWTLGGTADFHHEEGTWQFSCGNVKAPRNYSWVRVVMAYNNQVNFVDFSNLFLYKEQYGTDYEYDTKGNRQYSHSLSDTTSSATYDAYNNMLTSKAPGRSAATTYNWGSGETELRKHLLQKVTSPLGIVSTFDYDNYGNQTESVVKVSDNNNVLHIKTTTNYTSASTYVAKQKDARGNEVNYTTDPNKGVVTSVTDPSEQVVNTTYDVLRRPTKTSTMLNNQEVKTESIYDANNGTLKILKHNTTTDTSGDVTYTFDYDSLERQTAVTVGTGEDAHVLSTTAYDALTGQISQVNFGNGGKIINRYDSFGRLNGVRYDNETDERFTYHYDATGRVGMVEDHDQKTLTYADYDLPGRPARKTKLREDVHVYTGKLTYNDYELPAEFTELVGASKEKHSTAFVYDDNENRIARLNYDGSENDQVVYTYDDLGRIISRAVKINGQSNTTTYTYVPGGYGQFSTTGLIQTITQNGVTLTYTYDNNGNITSVSNGTKTTGYVYDAIGQLIRVNDQTDTTAGTNGTTWVFTYDLGGNILTKKAYVYTTGTVGTAVQSHSYTYGSSDWKDKLTAYDGVTIQSDGIGNPTTDGTWTYTWQHGRQLKQMSKTGETVTFEYNEDGLRTKKTSTSKGVTEYTLHGKNIVHLTRENQSLHFFYDGQGKPSIAEWNNGTTTTKYAYVYNLQGDVIALINSAGTKVVEYTYDAWGKPTSLTGVDDLETTLGTLNPFRYRGYVYDDETGLYYLRSRYYNAHIGRFIIPDSINEILSIHSLQPKFIYCYNNPIKFLDLDGQEATLNIYHPNFQTWCTFKPFKVGHVDISINGTVYSYGRYDKSHTWGIAGYYGFGIFMVQDEYTHMQAQLKNKNIVKQFKLNISSSVEKKMLDYFRSFMDEENKYEDKSFPGAALYRVPNNHHYSVYSLLLRNCVTFSMDALDYGLNGKLPSFLKYQNTPLDLYNTLIQHDFLNVTIPIK